MRDVGGEGYASVGTVGIVEFSVLPIQFCCEPKIALKINCQKFKYFTAF